jgi:hypothetical protein
MELHLRQGDVLLIEVKGLPNGAKPLPRNGRIVLAYGEVTGHAHAIADEFANLMEAEGKRYLRIDSGERVATLVHEEHATVEIPPGIYEVRQQREYSPEEIRNVRD